MGEIRREHAFVIADKIKSKFPSFTTDGWTSSANDSYMSFALYIEDAWDLVTLALSYSKILGTTMGEDLVRSGEEFVNDHDLKGRVVPAVTGCGPSTVKAGRAHTDSGVFKYIGCTNHRLESSTDIVFNAPGVKKCMAPARKSVTRHTKSSGGPPTLAECCAVLDIASLKVVQYLESDARAGRASSVPQGGDRIAREAGQGRSLSLFGRPMCLETAALRPGSVHVRSEEARV